MRRFDAGDIEITARETLYQGCTRLERLALRRRFDGGWTPPFTRGGFAAAKPPRCCRTIRAALVLNQPRRSG